jgi:putative ABC transport system ATP-binding protein
MGQEVIEVADLTKVYSLGEVELRALDGVSVSIGKGEFVAVMGPSGSGKSTFMSILGCLDRPTSGSYRLAGTPVERLSKDHLAEIRNRMLGFVFQGFNLLARTTALENVELPMFYNGEVAGGRKERAMAALKSVGLEGREGHFPNQLSGGQQQRVAIARALVNKPSIILADEPTGNLDSRTSGEVMAIFQRLNKEEGITVVLVTHEPDIAAWAGRHVHFKDGRIVSDEITGGGPHSVEK